MVLGCYKLQSKRSLRDGVNKMQLLEGMTIKNRYDNQEYTIVEVREYTILAERDSSIVEMSKSDLKEN